MKEVNQTKMGEFVLPSTSPKNKALEQKRTLEPEILPDSDHEMTQESPDLRRKSLTTNLSPKDISLLTNASPENVRFDSRKIDNEPSPNTLSP
jgi:hypothetical protein